MNLEDYAPSQPIDDRRSQQWWRPRQMPPNSPPFFPRERDPSQSVSLLDMVDASGIRGGLSRDLGYNMVGQDPRMQWRNRLPLPDVPLQNYPSNPAIPYEPATVGWDRPWTMGR
jgi:hypothetical protein